MRGRIAQALALASLLAARSAGAQSPEGPGEWGEDLLIEQGHPGLDTFFVLGFSRAGSFAYLWEGCGDEAGYTCASAVVVDLESDRVIDRLDWDDDHSAGNPAPDPDREQFNPNVRALLAKHGIEGKGTLVKGDTFVAGQSFQVVITSKDLVAPPYEFERTNTVSLVRETVSKRVGTTTEHGILDIGPPKPYGVVLSPYDRRAAILLVDQNYAGCIGSRASMVVLGADLDARYP